MIQSLSIFLHACALHCFFICVFSIAPVSASAPHRTVVLVTGASSGIGRSVVQLLARDPKYKVWATMRSTEFWDSPEQENVRIAQLDVTSDESVSNTVGRVINEDGKIDVLVNSAGYGVFGCLEAVDIDDAKVVYSLDD